MKFYDSVFSLWLAVTYGAVVVAVAIDFASGVRKARRAGIATRSRGYKMTCDKAVKYFLPMLCLTCVDVIASVFFVAPFLTMVMAAFNIFCEWRSVMESTHEKQEIRRAAETVRLVIDNHDDLVKLIARIVAHQLDPEAERKEVDNETH